MPLLFSCGFFYVIFIFVQIYSCGIAIPINIIFHKHIQVLFHSFQKFPAKNTYKTIHNEPSYRCFQNNYQNNTRFFLISTYKSADNTTTYRYHILSKHKLLHLTSGISAFHKQHRYYNHVAALPWFIPFPRYITNKGSMSFL